jgi:uncharacterized membrane protein
MALAPVFATESGPGIWANPVDGFLVSVAAILTAIGVGVVIWGAYCAVLRLIALESTAARLRLPNTDTAPVRLLFAAYLVSGLDFLIAGGVIRALVGSDWQQLSVLGSIALLRVLLGMGMRWQGLSGSVGMPPTLLEPPAAARNGASACQHVPAPSAPDARKPAEDPTPVAGQAAQ